MNLIGLSFFKQKCFQILQVLIGGKCLINFENQVLRWGQFSSELLRCLSQKKNWNSNFFLFRHLVLPTSTKNDRKYYISEGAIEALAIL